MLNSNASSLEVENYPSNLSKSPKLNDHLIGPHETAWPMHAIDISNSICCNVNQIPSRHSKLYSLFHLILVLHSITYLILLIFTIRILSCPQPYYQLMTITSPYAFLISWHHPKPWRVDHQWRWSETICQGSIHEIPSLNTIMLISISKIWSPSWEVLERNNGTLRREDD